MRMVSIVRRWAALSCSLVCLLTGCGSESGGSNGGGDSVLVEVEAEVDYVHNLDGLDGSVDVGTPMRGRYRMALDATPDDSQINQTSYFDAIAPGDLELSVGSYRFRNPHRGLTQVLIGDEILSSDPYDLWLIWVPKPVVRGPRLARTPTVALSLRDDSGAAFSSEALVTVPDLARFDSAELIVEDRDSDMVIVGTVRSLRVVDSDDAAPGR
jgi:hypothetical protein